MYISVANLVTGGSSSSNTRLLNMQRILQLFRHIPVAIRSSNVKHSSPCKVNLNKCD